MEEQQVPQMPVYTDYEIEAMKATALSMQSKEPAGKRAIIKLVSKGPLKGQYRFVLVAANGEIVAVSSPETYTQKHNAIETIRENFPNFKIIDKTKT